MTDLLHEEMMMEHTEDIKPKLSVDQREQNHPQNV